MKSLCALVSFHNYRLTIRFFERNLPLPVVEMQAMIFQCPVAIDLLVAILQCIIASYSIFLLLVLVRGGHETARRFFTPSNAHSYDKVVRRATFGRDHVWKLQILGALGHHQSVLELASGTGVLSTLLDSSGRKVVGLDLNFDYLRASMGKLGLPMAQGTAEVLPYRNECFDAIVSSYLAKYVDVEILVGECWRVLKPGGVAIFHDFTYPDGPIMQRLWGIYFRILRLCATFAPEWNVVFEQLDEVIRKSHWETRIQHALQSTGFRNVALKYYTAGTAAIVSAEKP